MKDAREPAISVVIPIHNTSGYLGKCLDSLRGQTFADYEVICVDDGSTDGSAETVRRRQEDDSRLKLIVFPDSRGVSTARNTGLDAAAGRWIYFLDSDDWLDPDYLEQMYAHALKSGLPSVCNVSYLLEDEMTGESKADGFGDFLAAEEQYFEPSFIQSHFNHVVWSRLYKKSFLTGNDIRFPLIKGGGEDIFFISLAELSQERSYAFRGPSYHYLQRGGSLMRGKDVFFHGVENYRALYRELCRRGIPLEGVKLFFGGPSLRLDTPQKYDFVKSYLLEIGPLIRKYLLLYWFYDLILLDVLESCPDYETFRREYYPEVTLNYYRKRRWKSR